MTNTVEKKAKKYFSHLLALLKEVFGMLKILSYLHEKNFVACQSKSAIGNEIHVFILLVFLMSCPIHM